MRDHRRRTEIRLLVLAEDGERIKGEAEKAELTSPGEAGDVARFALARSVQRFLYFSELPAEFRECNPAVPWGRLRLLRRRYCSTIALHLERPRTFPLILGFATREVPGILCQLAAPSYPHLWRNEPAGSQGIKEVLGRHRAQMQRLALRHGARRLRVYGSVARGEADADSDVDLLVDWGPNSDPLGVSKLKTRFEQLIGRKVDLHESQRTYWAIRDRVLAEAVPL